MSYPDTRLNPKARKIIPQVGTYLDAWPGDQMQAHGFVWQMTASGDWQNMGAVYTVTVPKTG